MEATAVRLISRPIDADKREKIIGVQRKAHLVGLVWPTGKGLVDLIRQLRPIGVCRVTEFCYPAIPKRVEQVLQSRSTRSRNVRRGHRDCRYQSHGGPMA